MIEKLKDISKVLLLPAAVLYFFGFICINSYYARFGLVSFDIVNSRFMIAGIYPVACLITVLYLAWKLHTDIKIDHEAKAKSIIKNLGGGISFILKAWLAAYVLNLLMQLGQYKAPSAQKILIFKPWLGTYDLIGEKISQLHIGSVGLEFVFKETIYLFSYIFLIIISVILCIIFSKWYQSAKKNINNDSTKKTPVKVDTDTSEVVAEQEKPENKYILIILFSLEFFLISIFASLLIYSSSKLSVELFDFHSFSQKIQTSQGLIFAWIFNSSIIVYIFLISTKKTAEQLKLKFVDEVKTFDNVQWAFQQLVIPILGTLFLFGATIFPKIPFTIGGGEPRAVKIIMADSSEKFDEEHLFLLGESNQFLFVVGEDSVNKINRALQINKSEVVYIETKNSDDLINTK